MIESILQNQVEPRSKQEPWTLQENLRRLQAPSDPCEGVKLGLSRSIWVICFSFFRVESFENGGHDSVQVFVDVQSVSIQSPCDGDCQEALKSIIDDIDIVRAHRDVMIQNKVLHGSTESTNPKRSEIASYPGF
jgi:hypothetical protein